MYRSKTSYKRVLLGWGGKGENVCIVDLGGSKIEDGDNF